MNGWSKNGLTISLADLIGAAMQAKIATGKGSFHTKGALKKRTSKRDKTRQFFAANPDVKPWPLRPRLVNKSVLKRKGDK